MAHISEQDGAELGQAQGQTWEKCTTHATLTCWLRLYSCSIGFDQDLYCCFFWHSNHEVIKASNNMIYIRPLAKLYDENSQC